MTHRTPQPPPAVQHRPKPGYDSRGQQIARYEIGAAPQPLALAATEYMPRFDPLAAAPVDLPAALQDVAVPAERPVQRTPGKRRAPVDPEPERTVVVPLRLLILGGSVFLLAVVGVVFLGGLNLGMGWSR